MRILIADPSRTMRNIARAVLAQLGYYDVDEASSSREALSRASFATFDLCLFDHALADLDANALIESLQKAGSATRCILLRNADLPEPATEIRGVEILNKPFAPEALRRCIEAALSGPSAPLRVA